MSLNEGSGKKRGNEPESLRSEKKRRAADGELDADPDLDSDIKGIMLALQNIKEKTMKDEQQKSDEIISRVASEIRSMMDDVKTKFEKERQTFLKALSKSGKECESTLKDGYSKFQAAYDKFSKEKTVYVQTSKEIFCKYEEEKEKLFLRYEQQRKKDKATLADLEKSCTEKITVAEESLKKKKRDDKHFSVLRKLGSFFESGSDDDFGHDD